MQRWISIVLAVGVVWLSVLLSWKGMSAHPRLAARADGTSQPGENGATSDGGFEAAATALSADVDAADLLPEPGDSVPDTRADGGVGSRMPDGTPVPPLPDKSPKQVRFGVVLVSFAGAQGAPPNARPQREAKDLADKLASEARADFHGAVIHGDSGSTDDAGRMPRGVLELSTEYVLFTMPTGKVSDPIETPRGYWIVKRIE